MVFIDLACTVKPRLYGPRLFERSIIRKHYNAFIRLNMVCCEYNQFSYYRT